MFSAHGFYFFLILILIPLGGGRLSKNLCGTLLSAGVKPRHGLRSTVSFSPSTKFSFQMHLWVILSSLLNQMEQTVFAASCSLIEDW